MKHPISLTSVTALAVMVIALLLAPFKGHAVDYEFVAADNSTETKACLYAVTDDLSGLKLMASRGFDRNYKRMSLELKCNGQDINHFSHSYGAVETSAYLNKRVSSKFRVDDDIEIIDISSAKPNAEGKAVIYIASK
ncbi:DUF3718 domain-containing protein [Thalassotalea mangrovi]|uniref:DUF3718 domain-containing protein n=1 Tax=Thalassotalea mangrovi TaxID=2572245 RepID=A0A4U1B8X5_9GAMM|nr:DUF3718 domain-containing protein [Thalassotalea mangrovi]TKB47156.1 DUF3718 domain-containing protein [Thalassotalea mangrovi]